MTSLLRASAFAWFTLGAALVGTTACKSSSTGTDSEACSTCDSLGANCGQQPSGCNTVLDCGVCVTGETCGAAGPNLCGVGTCTPATCESLGACGPTSDNCGAILDCAPCDGGVDGGTGTGGDGNLGTGGAPATGGAPGTGGAPPEVVDPTTVLPRSGLLHGTAPSSVSASDALAAYNQFKGAHIKTCGSQMYVPNADQGNDTVSEGIAYGMLLAVSHGDKTTFDALHSYYQQHLNTNGLMAWRVKDCGANVDNTAAIDGDLDAAMAYIMAHCKWGDTYAPLAIKTLDAISQHGIIRSGGVYYVKPGDNWGGTTHFNPSYFSPAYFRAFALYQPSNAERWNGVADSTYTVLNVGRNSTTSFVPDWMTSTGACVSGSSCNYAWEAVRYPWRIATDYFWWGTPAAQTLLTPLGTWAKSQSASGIGDEYSLSGGSLANYGKGAVVASLAIGTMAVDSAGSAGLFTELKNRSSNAADWYYSNALRALYLTTAAGLFNACPNP